MIMIALVLTLLSTEPVPCPLPVLMLRTETMPRTPAFDLGAKAFDRATKAWNDRHYLEAATGFLSASEHFALAGSEGNWKYAWQNAARAFEQAGKVDAGKASFEAAAVKDSAHAEALRAAAAKLTARTCP
jgi:hypothetical protein